MSPLSVLITLLCLGQVPDNEVSLKALQQRVETTQVWLSNEAGQKAKLVEKPVFHYSDELRQIENAGVWLWTDRGRPVAAMKVERYQTGRFPIPWLYCITSLSSELVHAEWADAKPFQAKQPGVKWQALSDDPATTRRARLVQMRDIARRFPVELQRDAARVRDRSLHSAGIRGPLRHEVRGRRRRGRHSSRSPRQRRAATG